MSSTETVKMKRLVDRGARYFTPTVWILFIFAFIGLVIAFGRFFFGLESVTNFDDDYPWGIWKGFNIASLIAIGGCGFTMAFLTHIYGRHKYSPLIRQAIIFAMLCYTFAPLSLIVDLGRYWAVWHPIFPRWWQGNSVLFEVAMCVILYVTVLYIEMMPFAVEQYLGKPKFIPIFRIFDKLWDWILLIVNKTLLRILPLFVILGVVLSCLHQSSLGTLMVIAGAKIHPLWQTPLLPLLFLISAIAVGFPIVALLSLGISHSFKKDFEIDLLQYLLRYTPWFLGLYLVLRFVDIFARGAGVYIFQADPRSYAFLIESVLLIAGFIMFCQKKYRETPTLLFIASLSTVSGIILTRLNAWNVAYRPPLTDHIYMPSLLEVLFTIGLYSGLILFYRFIIIYFPIVSMRIDAVENRSGK